MIRTPLKISDEIFHEITEQIYIDFLNEFGEKQANIEEKLNEVERKKEKIVSKILENKEKIEDAPKEKREHLSNAESVLESIEQIYENLTKLQNCYRSVEKTLIIVEEQKRLTSENYDLKAGVYTVIEKIKEAQNTENEIKQDNEKNNMIIDSYLEKSNIENVTIEEPISIFDLNSDNLKDNPVLKICEKRVELPYTKKEIEDFLKTYPNEYKTIQDVIRKEFMIHISVFNKHPILSRFKEAYYLCRNKEMMSILDSLNFAKSMMFKSEINPYIIAAVKSVKQLNDYIDCLETNKLEDYKYFKIVFEVNPLAV